MSNNVRVVCRFRPLNSKEIAQGEGVIFSVPDEERMTVTLNGQEYGKHSFTFDKVFDGTCTQKEVYEYAAKPVVEDIMKGYNGTIFVYGQTSSGKTHTMQGPSIDDQQLRGIIPRMNSTIFEGVQNADQNIEFLVKASYIEIYKEKIRDLLDNSKGNLQVREEKTKGIWVDGATEVYVSSEQDVLDVIRTGSQNRAIAETKMNSESSRSHSIFILTVNQKNLADLSNKTGKLYLVDLAGSEKVEKTGAQGNTLDEAKMINKSLSALGNVINALTDGKSSHVPYRDSKLTRVLQESLGGNSRTTLVINCSPASYNEAETLSTLRFGTRAKSIKNSAKVNAERSVGELKILLAKAEKEIARLQETITALQEEVAVYKNGGVPVAKTVKTEDAQPGAAVVVNLPSVTRLQEKIAELEETVKRLEEEKQSATDQYESLTEELKEKETELDAIKEDVNTLRQTEQTLSKENELLIVKLADITIANEKIQYENNEHMLTIETLNAQATSYKDEIDNLKKKMDTLANERNKAKPVVSHDWADKEDVKRGEQGVESKIEAVGPSTKSEQPSEDGHRLRSELIAQRGEIEQLKREKELLQLSLDKLRVDYEEKGSALGAKLAEPSTGGKDLALLERELQLVKDQTTAKLSEFDAVKAALLKDLENRCQKVIELEILLDEAREQYQTLLVQVKNSNSKTLQQKCIFLQRNLEQLTTVQQQLVNENNRLKLENQVYVKQLAIRNERIHGLELLLQDAQEKLQKHASSADPADDKRKATRTTTAGGMKQPAIAARKGAAQLNIATGGRIAKPLRGGGGGTAAPTPTEEESPTDPERRKSGSIWDLFRGSSKTQLQRTDSTEATTPRDNVTNE